MGQSTLSLIILTVIFFLFVSRLIPIGITAVLGSIAMAMAGIITFGEAFSSFGNDTVMLIVGMIVVGNAIAETGLTDVLGKKIIKLLSNNKNEVLFLIPVLFVVVVISAFMSNTATVAVFLPLVACVAKASKNVITKKNTYMAVGIAAVLGGNLTLVASTPQIVAQGILMQTEGCEPMSFFDLTRGAIPAIIVMLVYYATIGNKLQRKVFSFDEVESNTHARTSVVDFKKDKAIICGIAFLWCIVGFVFNIFTLGTIAIIAACVCVAAGCISLERAGATMDWTTVLVLGGTMGFAKGIEKSGTLSMLADTLIGLMGVSVTPFIAFCVFLIFSMLASNLLSSTVTAALLVPIAIEVAKQLGSNPTLFAITVVMGISFGISTPVCTPPITMTLGGGYRFSDYVIVGGTLSVLLAIVAIITLPLLYGI
jgi:anion transporter